MEFGVGVHLRVLTIGTEFCNHGWVKIRDEK